MREVDVNMSWRSSHVFSEEAKGWIGFDGSVSEAVRFCIVDWSVVVNGSADIVL